ncbi:MAG: NAD-dependent protein deacetylase [Vicinamibacteria bacterium]|jgi:NAD-dependent SIR2 family protein deacetylase|nr:NAD-dependent protein deacetylase [Vicinamibacteria bacterium]
MSKDTIAAAATAIAKAEALLITAGAGMGVDSGLPDFRGPEGFWRAYPPYRQLGLRFEELANPTWFERDPCLAWGFYGHRLNLYRATAPHAGYGLLLRWARRMPHGAFVFTSNVDGQFERAGFSSDRIVECHGSLLWLQCMDSCGMEVYPAADVAIDVDETTGRAREALPHCPRCGALARPNVLMFGDWGWRSERSSAQEERLASWIESLGDARLAIVECGAGHAVPTVRLFSEQAARRPASRLIRINPRDPAVPPSHLALPVGALEALSAIDRLWK